MKPPNAIHASSATADANGKAFNRRRRTRAHASDVIEQLRTWDGRPVTLRMTWHGAPTEMLTFGALYGDDDANELDGWTVTLEGEKKIALVDRAQSSQLRRVPGRAPQSRRRRTPPEVFASCPALTLRMSAKVDD